METAHGAAERFRGWGRGVESDGGAVEDFLPEMAELAQRAGCLGTAASFPHPTRTRAMVALPRDERCHGLAQPGRQLWKRAAFLRPL